MNLQKAAGLVFAICAMVLMPTPVYAAETVEQALVLEGEAFELHEELSAEYPVNTLSEDGPALAEGRFAKWVDRLKDLPDYAAEFYDWLVDNAEENGALADVTKGEYVNSSYMYTVRTITGTTTVAIEDGDTGEDIKAKAKAAASQVMSANMQETFSYVSAVFDAFDRDHPEVFWLSGEGRVSTRISYRWGCSGNICTVSYTQPVYFCLQTADFDIRSDEYTDVNSIAAAIKERDACVSGILEACTATTRYEQIKQLNWWLTKNNCYNTGSNLSNIDKGCRECINALKGSVGTSGPVCEGYSKAFKVLCDKLDIPCVLVNGVADNGIETEAHMWNYVQMDDGKWYAADITWDDPVVSGVTAAGSGCEDEDYLLIGEDTVIGGKAFGTSHVVYNIVSNGGLAFVNGPELADVAYEPIAVSAKNGILQAEDGNYYYYADGAVDTDKNGLVYDEANSRWIYMEAGQWITSKVGLAEYGGGRFLVVGGVYDTGVNGLYCNEEDSTWYYFSAGQVQEQSTGLVEYDGAWFYVVNGALTSGYSGLIEYNGAKFLVTGGQVRYDQDGLYLNTTDNTWYYIGGGQVQEQYTGLVEYDGAWFYVVSGVLASDYAGFIEYNGGRFLVSAGQVQYAQNGLYLSTADDTWYYISGGQVQEQYTGLVEYDGAWFYLVNGVLDTTFSGTVEYNGTEFEVINGSVIL